MRRIYGIQGGSSSFELAAGSSRKLRYSLMLSFSVFTVAL